MPVDKNAFNVKSYAAFAAVVCLLVFLRALTCDFINWDDPLYVTENPGIRILDWQFIKESFSVSYMGWWMPLTWISFALDYYVWGLNPFGYHLTNILLHAANTGIVVLIAGQLFRNIDPDAEGSGPCCRVAALLSGLLWGIHPLRVESVVWVTERKDVLNGLFSLGAVLFYLYYVERRSRGEKGSAIITVYLVSLGLLFLSLTAKPVSVVIPAMLLVIDWYPLGRLKRETIVTCIKDKIPFGIIAAGMAFATLFFARGESILVSYTDFSLFKRLILAGNSIFEYLKMTVYPVGLVNLYLLPRVFPISYYVGAAVSVSLLLVCAVTWRSRPWYLATLLLFILPLVPVLGFFQNGAQAYADRFTYLPGVALGIAAAAFFTRSATARQFSISKLNLMILIALVLIVALLSIQLTGAWKNPETLWTRVIAVQPVGRAYYLRAEYRIRKGQYVDAAEDITRSIRMGEAAGYPGVFYLYALRGDALSKARQYEAAVKDFSEAIRLKPYSTFYYNRGVALKALGRQHEAEDDFRQAGEDRGAINWQNLLDN